MKDIERHTTVARCGFFLVERRSVVLLVDPGQKMPRKLLVNPLQPPPAMAKNKTKKKEEAIIQLKIHPTLKKKPKKPKKKKTIPKMLPNV